MGIDEYFEDEIHNFGLVLVVESKVDEPQRLEDLTGSDVHEETHHDFEDYPELLPPCLYGAELDDEVE